MGGSSTPTNQIDDLQMIANAPHVHRRLGELWEVSADVDVSSGDILDVAIENPTDSGHDVTVVLWGVGIDGETTITQYRDSGIYSGSGTAITPRNYDSAVSDGAQNFVAEYQTGTGEQLVDTSADRRFNGGVHSASGQANQLSATATSRPELDMLICEGQTYALHIDSVEAVNPLVSITVAEWDPSQSPVQRR